MSESPPRLRKNVKSYPHGVRWCIDYSPEFLKKLKETDPKAYEFLWKFIEAEYGGNAKLLYDDPEERKRCQNAAGRLQNDVMHGVVDGANIDDIGMLNPETVEDGLNAAIDGKHILHSLSVSQELPKRPSKSQKRRSKIQERRAKKAIKEATGGIHGFSRLKKIVRGK